MRRSSKRAGAQCDIKPTVPPNVWPIVYPNGRPSMADLFADRIGEVRVEVQQYPIPAELRSGDYYDVATGHARHATSQATST